MEEFKVWIPVLASSVAIVVSLLSWRATRHLQREKVLGDFEAQARIKQIESILKSSGEEVMKVNERSERETKIIAEAIQRVQDYRNYARRLIAILDTDEPSEIHPDLLSQLNSAIQRVEEAHKEVFGQFLETYDLSTLHSFKRRVQDTQPALSEIFLAKAPLKGKERALKLLVELVDFGKDCQSELLAVSYQNQEKHRAEIERVRFNSLA